MNILICGDSFAAKWNDSGGWPELLSKDFNVTNLAQAGVGEYKILQQLKTVDLNSFDKIIVSHTSPSRVHTAEHPLHKKGLHKNCDLIYTDIADRINWFNPALKSAQDWFRYHYDDNYQIEIYLLLRKEIRNLLKKVSYISITHTEISKKYAIEHNNIDFSDLWMNYRGIVNHYTVEGNQLVYKRLLDTIKK